MQGAQGRQQGGSGGGSGGGSCAGCRGWGRSDLDDDARRLQGLALVIKVCKKGLVKVCMEYKGYRYVSGFWIIKVCTWLKVIE